MVHMAGEWVKLGGGNYFCKCHESTRILFLSKSTGVCLLRLICAGKDGDAVQKLVLEPGSGKLAEKGAEVEVQVRRPD
jgi:hypothetical protein